MNNCILCAESFGNDPNPAMVCPEYKEAFLSLKSDYFLKKKLSETTELDEKVFQGLCEKMDIPEMIDREINSLFPSSLEEIIEMVEDICKEFKKEVPWLTQQEGRYGRFMEYLKNQVRIEYLKQTRQL